MIRIDYTQIDNIKFHIDKALLSYHYLYFSTETMYSHISTKLILPKLLSLEIQS